MQMSKCVFGSSDFSWFLFLLFILSSSDVLVSLFYLILFFKMSLVCILGLKKRRGQ